MAAFTDTKGHIWQVDVNVATIKRVRSLGLADLADPMAGKPALVEVLTLDPVKLVDVLYGVLKPQADALGVSDDAFAERLDGEPLGDAITAFFEAWGAFFIGARRTEAAAVIRKTGDLLRAAVRLGTEQIEAVDVEQIASTSMTSASSSLPSSAGSPGSSPTTS